VGAANYNELGERSGCLASSVVSEDASEDEELQESVGDSE